MIQWRREERADQESIPKKKNSQEKKYVYGGTIGRYISECITKIGIKQKNVHARIMGMSLTQNGH